MIDNPPDPAHEFGYHVCAVCAIAMLMLTLDATRPNDNLPLALLGLAATTRWAERQYNKNWWLPATIYLDTALGLMTANILASWS